MLAPLVVPARGALARTSLIFLHGLGDSGHGFRSLLQTHLSDYFPSLRIILPNAQSRPLTINGGAEMPQWFDITHQQARERPELQDVAGMERTRGMLESMIAEERAQGRNVILGGFSQGAVMSLFTGLQTSQPLSGLLILSGFLPQHTTLQAKTSPTFPTSTMPIFLAHGTHDRTITFNHGVAIRDFLEWKRDAGGLGCEKVTWCEVRGMGHSVDEEDEMVRVRAWVGAIVGSDGEQAESEGK